MWLSGKMSLTPLPVDLSGDSTLGNVVAGEKWFLCFRWPWWELRRGPEEWMRDGCSKDVPGDTPAQKLRKECLWSDHLHMIDLVWPRSLLHGCQTTCSSVVVTRLIFVLEMGWLCVGRRAPRKTVFAIERSIRSGCKSSPGIEQTHSVAMTC